MKLRDLMIHLKKQTNKNVLLVELRSFYVYIKILGQG